MKIDVLIDHIKRAAAEGGIWLAAIIAIFLLGVVAILQFNPVEKAGDKVGDQFASAPKVPDILADHKDERGDGLERGSTVGAAPNKAIPRPTAYLAERGIEFTFYGSPNWSSRGVNPIESMVLHVTGNGTCPGMRSWFSRPESGVSTQYGVCKDGTVEGYVEAADVAWHAGIMNRPDTTNPLIASWANGRVNPNSRSIGIEVLLAPGEKLDDYPEMKASLLALMSWLNIEVGIPLERTNVIGHYQIDSVSRSIDPTCCYDIDALLAELTVAPVQDVWGDCDVRYGNCWLNRPAWVFPDGHVFDLETGEHVPLPSR